MPKPVASPWPNDGESLRLDQIDLFGLDVIRKATYSRKTVDGAHPVLLIRLKARDQSGWGEVSGRLQAFEAARAWARTLLGKPLPLQPDPFGRLGDFRADEDTPLYERIRRFLRPLRERGSIRTYRLADRALVARTAFRSRQQRKVREGFSIAWYDLVGRIRGTSVADLLGGLQRTHVKGMPVVHLYDRPRTVELVGGWHGLGFEFIKIKLSGTLSRDLDTLAAVHQAYPTLRLQADANYGYRNMDDVVRAADVLPELGVEYFEDPVMGALGEYVDLCRRSRVRVMVDGRAWWPNIRRVAAARAAHHVNHHSNRQGGLDWAVRIAQCVADAGITSGIGSGGLTGIQCAAFQTLSGVIGLTRPCEAMLQYRAAPFEQQRFARDPAVIDQPYPIRDGTIELSTEPGLGIRVDEPLVYARAVRHETFCATS